MLSLTLNRDSTMLKSYALMGLFLQFRPDRCPRPVHCKLQLIKDQQCICESLYIISSAASKSVQGVPVYHQLTSSEGFMSESSQLCDCDKLLRILPWLQLTANAWLQIEVNSVFLPVQCVSERFEFLVPPCDHLSLIQNTDWWLAAVR